MLSLIAATLIVAGTCAKDETLTTEEHGDFIVCNQARIPAIAQMLNTNAGWQITVTNPRSCEIKLKVALQVISGDAGVIELLQRLEKESHVIFAKIDVDQRRATITCTY